MINKWHEGDPESLADWKAYIEQKLVEVAFAEIVRQADTLRGSKPVDCSAANDFTEVLLFDGLDLRALVRALKLAEFTYTTSTEPDPQ